MHKNFILLILLIIFSSCSTDDNIVGFAPTSDTDLYNNGLDLLKKKKFDEASEVFTELDLQHPYSRWATKGQLMSGFALYKANKYDEAIFVLSKFINLNPNNQNLPYAFYLKGYCYYERISLVTRDQKIAKRAYESFTELQKKYPNSIYSKKASNHLILLNNQLAGKEMSVGKYYQKRKKFLAAILRYKVIIRDYKRSAQIPEALYRGIECYLSLGLDLPAVRFISVLKYNYPKSIWTTNASRLIKEFKLDYNNTLDSMKNKTLDLENLIIEEYDLI